MKKTMLTTALALFLAGGLFAQDSKVEDVLNANRFGLYVGLGSSWLNPKTTTKDEYAVANGKAKTAFSFGLNAERVLNSRYSIYSGIGVDWEGGQITSTLQSSSAAPDSTYVKSADVGYSLQYVRVPLGLKLKAANIADLRIFGLIGADAGILISKKTDITRVFYADGAAYTTNTTTTDNEIGTKNSATVPFNIGYQIGVGVEYDITDNNAVYLKLLYRNGLIDVTNPDGAIGTGNDDRYRFKDGNIASNAIGIRIGYFF